MCTCYLRVEMTAAYWNDSLILTVKKLIYRKYTSWEYLFVFIIYIKLKEILSVLPPFIIYNKYFYNGKEMINFENINGNDDKDTYRLSRILRIQCTYKYVHIIHVFNEFL